MSEKSYLKTFVNSNYDYLLFQLCSNNSKKRYTSWHIHFKGRYNSMFYCKVNKETSQSIQKWYAVLPFKKCDIEKRYSNQITRKILWENNYLTNHKEKKSNF